MVHILLFIVLFGLIAFVGWLVLVAIVLKTGTTQPCIKVVSDEKKHFFDHIDDDKSMEV